MRILITGAGGQLGRALQAALAGHDLVLTDVAPGAHAFVDICDPQMVAAAVREARPDAVAHLAAMTDVDGCARDPERALRINALGTRNVALACQPGDLPLLYLSTNEVFDGAGAEPYYEWDAPHPINAYGRSKWVGETYVRALCRRYYIVRTAWLFTAGGANFIHKILQLAARAAAGEAPALRVVTDEVANPTYGADLARALAALIETGLFGTYHLVNAGACSRYDFARRALDLAGYADLPIQPIARADFPRASNPPAYAALHNFVGAAAGITLRPWEQALAEFIAGAGARPQPAAE